MKKYVLALLLCLIIVSYASASIDEWSGCYWIIDKEIYSGTDLYLVGYGYLGQPVYFDVSGPVFRNVHRGMIVNLWRDEYEVWTDYACHCVPSASGQCWPMGTVWLPVLP